MTGEVFCSPSDVSQALGVSTSTVKRWVDEGVLPARKTVGGHRRMLRADVLRLVREGNFPCLDLGRLDLPAGTQETEPALLSQRLLDGLRQGDINQIRSVLHGAYAAGVPIEVLGDAVSLLGRQAVGQDRLNAHLLEALGGSSEAVAVRLLLLAEDADRSVSVAAICDPERDATLDQHLVVREREFVADWRCEFDQQCVGAGRRILVENAGQFA